MNGLPYYKRYPTDFIRGTVSLPFELKVTYSYILDLIYAHGGKLPDEARYIAGSLGVSIRKWKSLRRGLIDAGKLQEQGGCLTNHRALSEVEKLAKYSRNQSENASGPRENNSLKKPPLSHTDTDTEKKDSEAKASDEDFAKQLWDRGVAYLVRNGVPERNAKSFIGKCRKDHADKDIFDAFARASKEGVIDPIPWIVKALGGAKKSSNDVWAEVERRVQ